MTSGRLTDYNEEILDKARHYIENYEDYGDAVPMVEGLACVLGISRETVYAWAKQEDKEIFSDIVTQLRSKKSRVLQNGGLTNKFNAKISGLLLGHEGYREKMDMTSDGKKLELVPAIMDKHNEDE